jgi:GNAT superfamily N-acetyltransferase
MTIVISETTESELASFEAAAWAIEDLKNYGKEVPWTTWEPRLFAFKAVVDGRIAGSVCGHLLAGVVSINRIIVVEAYRRDGVGSSLLAHVEQFAALHKAHKIILFTGADWGSNQFYDSHGYQKIAELPAYYLARDFVILSKQV